MVPGGREGSARRNGTIEGLEGDWRLAARAGAPGGGGKWRPAAWWSLPGDDDAVMMLQARGAWWCVMLARRSEMPKSCLLHYATLQNHAIIDYSHLSIENLLGLRKMTHN